MSTDQAAESAQQIPLWLDCDPGHDDVFAILLAAHHPHLKLLGISTVHGNGSLDNVTNNAGSVLEAIGRTDIPVYPGSRKPYCRAAVHAENIHGDSGLDGTDLLPKPTKPPVRSPNYLIAMRDALLAQPKHTAWLVGTATTTNIGLLFAAFPEVGEHIAGLSLMGGAVGNGFTKCPISLLPGHEKRIGNWSEYAEFNIYCDPESAQSIFSNPVVASKTVLIALDLTHQVEATPDVLQSILYSNPATKDTTTLRQLLYDLLTYFSKTYRDVFGLVDGPPLHDPIAVAAVLSNLNVAGQKQGNFAKFLTLNFDDQGGERFGVEVVTDGQHGMDPLKLGQLGRTLVSDLVGEEERARGGVAIPRGVDLKEFWGMITDCVRRADAWNEQALQRVN